MRRFHAVLLILATLISLAACYGSCLHLRSQCLRSANCRPFLDKFKDSCGYNVERCTGSSPSDCVHTLRQLRDIFRHQTCICYEALGSIKECEWFRQAIYSNPCEKRLDDVSQERRIQRPDEYTRFETSTVLAIQQGFTLPSTPRRTTRSPVSEKIKEWKEQLSGDLETKGIMQKLTCNAALYDVCLRHVSCRQLWKLFRANCDVDGENNCKMQHKELCWQSFEGLTWTGLGSCHCPSNHSDCHWIRLHTNYNKCIYELSKTGDFPPFSDFEARRNGGPPISPPAPMPPPEAPKSGFALKIQTQQQTPPTTQKPAPITQMTPRQTFRTTTKRPVTTFPPPPLPRLMTVQPQSPAEGRQIQRQNHQHSGVRVTLRTSQEAGAPMTTTPLLPTVHAGPTRAFRKFVPRHNALRSSCNDALARCNSDSSCKFHVSELTLRCSTSCERHRCAPALQRFSSYVPRPLSEPLIFCHCAPNDASCAEIQALFYPSCLYTPSEAPRTCTQMVIECSQDVRCHQLRTSIASVCPVSKGECATDHLDACRQTLLYSRGSLLEAPCYCSQTDYTCIKYQNAMIPNNPCIEKAMLQYSKLMGYMTPPKTHVQSNRVDSSEETKQAKPPHPTRVHHEKQRKTADENIRSTKATFADHGSVPLGVAVAPTFKPSMRLETTPVVEFDDDVLVTRPDTQLEATHIDWLQKQQRKQNEPPPTQMDAPTPQSELTKPTKESTGEESNEIADVVEPPSIMERKSGEAGDSAVALKSAQPEPSPEIRAAKLAPKPINRQKAARATTAAPAILESAEESARRGKIPKLVTSTAIPTTGPMTTEYITMAPPLTEEKCSLKDANGKDLFVHVGSIVRRNLDWAGRCSSWCECRDVEDLVCERLPCHEAAQCDALITKMTFGERLYVQDRGACMCENGVFVCDTPEKIPDLLPGLYILAGFSLADLALLRGQISHNDLERAGFLSAEADVGKDIASQLQWALERRLPEDTKCRIVVLASFPDVGNVIYRVEWFGENYYTNETAKWRSDGTEKICSQYIRPLVDSFALGESPRYQLVLSTVKQLRFLDSLDALPPAPQKYAPPSSLCVSLLIILLTPLLHLF